MQKRTNKKGQDLSIGTLILIVLGIIVLVLLVLGFSLGWSNLWEKINIFGGGNSIGDVVTACNLAATQGGNGQYTYCQDFKKVKVDGKSEYLNCQDDRIQSSLTTKLTCSEEYSSEEVSAKKYCEGLKASSNFDENTKVNGDTCKNMGVVKEDANNAATTDAQKLAAYTTECNGKGNGATVTNKDLGSCPVGQEVVQVTSEQPAGKICCRPQA